MDAATTYGYGTYSHERTDRPISENVSMGNLTRGTVADNRQTSSAVGGLGAVQNSFHAHPVFWLFVLLLIFTGYIGLMFDANLKNVGAVRTKVGK